MTATVGVDVCLRGGLVDVPSTMLRYPHSISSSVGTRPFCECARIWQSNYDLVTRNQPLYGRGTFSRGQHGRLSAFQCSHNHPPPRGAHTSELAVLTCEVARSFQWSAMVMRHALATALVNTAMFELLPQRCHHASRAPPQGSRDGRAARRAARHHRGGSRVHEARERLPPGRSSRAVARPARPDACLLNTSPSPRDRG